MQHNKMEFTQLAVVIILTFCTYGVYGQKSHVPAPMNKDQVDDRVGKAQKSYGDLKQDIEQGK